jgi:hypothetical protein
MVIIFYKYITILKRLQGAANCIWCEIPRPGLSEALFAERSGAKKRERKTDKGAQNLPKIIRLKNRIFAQNLSRRFEGKST